MSKVKRLRVFAGPNGSGKSTLFETIKEKFSPDFYGIYLNSDLIEKEISEMGFINIDRFNLQLHQIDFEKYCTSANGQSLIAKSIEKGYPINLTIRENILISKSDPTHSYEASLITAFLREKLIETNQNFSFETVMSHPSKLDEIKSAKIKGYRTYLYFICLDDPDLNISRVHTRVELKGHAVDPERIPDRYSRTLELLLSAMKLTDRSYLFDNSDSMKLIAETEDGNLTIHVDEDELPNWFIRYVINKLEI